LDFKTPRKGRAFTLDVKKRLSSNEFEQVSMALAIFPLSPDNQCIPPYPGVPYKHTNTPNASASCYVDGTQGAFDARRYPQLYNPRRPWLPFHDLPTTFAWDSINCDIMTSVDYFRWNKPGNPSRDGHWLIRRLGELFSKRELMESEFRGLVYQAEKLADALWWFNDKESRSHSLDMPWFNTLDWDTVLGWSSWIEGRDQVGYLLQYVAELKALNRWLRATIELIRPRQTNNDLLDHSLMGTWASTITCKGDWTLLLRNKVPIYIITSIPPSHPISSHLVPGNLDGDERYRENIFDVEHSLEPFWLFKHSHVPEALPSLDLASAGILPTN
jgi:hypothetical protein